MIFLANFSFDRPTGCGGGFTGIIDANSMEEAQELFKKFFLKNQKKEPLKGIAKIYLESIHTITTPSAKPVIVDWSDSMQPSSSIYCLSPFNNTVGVDSVKIGEDGEITPFIAF